MVELARQLKESSLMMNQSVQETEKVWFFHLVLYSFWLCLHWVFCGYKLLWWYCTKDLLFSWPLVEKLTYLLMQILDSTEKAVEHSLASTGRATSRAAEVYSLTSKTTCFQWLLLFVMTCMFVMVVLLIRITWRKKPQWHSSVAAPPLCSMGSDVTRNPPIQEFNLSTTRWTVYCKQMTFCQVLDI